MKTNISEVDYTQLKWKQTDIDNFQYGRKVSDGVYQFKEFNRNLFHNKFWDLKEMSYVEAIKLIEADFNCSDFWIEDTIVLENFTESEICEHISGYYKSIEEIKEIYGVDSDFIIAECIFEQQSGLY